MAKSGIVTIDGEGGATFEDRPGLAAMTTDALTTLISTTSAPVGYTALLQRAALLIGGNLIGVQSASGRLGVGVAGKNIYFGR